MLNLKNTPTLLFTPGTKLERFNKTQESGAGGIILDLEDSVPMQDKRLARECIFNYLSGYKKNNFQKIIRINNLSTEQGIQDLTAIKTASVEFDAIVYPKTESPEHLNLITDVLGKAVPVIALIESPQGVFMLERIVKYANNLVALALGAGDFAAAVGCQLTDQALLYVRSQLVLAAGYKSIACYDSPYFDFHNSDGLLQTTEHIKALGFTGKMAIHPGQIAVINKVFEVDQQEYKKAVDIIKIYEASDGKACQFEGKMIDVPIYNRAKQIIAKGVFP